MTRGSSERRCATPMRSARPRITSATCRTSPLRRTCASLPSTFSTARPQNLTPRPSGTATRRRCWRTSRPSRPPPFKSASRPLSRPTRSSISWRRCAAVSPRTPREPHRVRQPGQLRRANGRECHAAPRRRASAQPRRDRVSGMNEPVSKLARCAIYTRKSSEHNLDLAFTSLDAQREACEAYIRSQAHEGWRAIPGRYDDGAFSGASLERPALQQLLADIRAGTIDIVLVYKVDQHNIDRPCPDIGQELLQRGALERGAGECPIVIAAGDRPPAFVRLTPYICLAGLTLCVERGEGKVEVMLARLAGINGAARELADGLVHARYTVPSRLCAGAAARSSMTLTPVCAPELLRLPYAARLLWCPLWCPRRHCGAAPP